MRDLPRRTLTAVVYGAIVLLAVAAPPAVFWLLLAAAAVLATAELRSLRTGCPSIVLAVAFFAGLASLGTLRQLGTFGVREETAGGLPVWLLLVLVPTWGADIAAYLVGSAWGRRRLAPRVSPGKTWEGTLAGFAACAILAFAVGAAYGLPRPLVAIAAIGLGPVGLAGDLLESFVKRRAGVKDSGTLLPGHGGVLDRLDSLVSSAVFVLLLVGLWAASQLGAEGGLG